ncbi:hypothetical protein C8J35_1513 [Rhizobium sp. PP-F2F-G38]|nr:hypothetical protein C8J35_1513 [Rhizobium sp. PP-F2F-G38]
MRLMQKRKILVIGPSLGATFMKFLTEDTVERPVSFDVFAINGSAFTAPNVIEATDSSLVFNDAFAEGSNHSWYSNIGLTRSVDLAAYSGIFYLDPLFILGGFMREQLFGQQQGICPAFLEGADKYYSNEEISAQIGQYRPISVAQWLAIYENWRIGTVNTLIAIRSISEDIPVILLPPVSPPARQLAAAYSYYNLKEQRLIGRHLSSRFGASFFLQPVETMDSRLATLDHFHAPAPDPHHPQPEFYSVLMERIDFDTISPVSGLKDEFFS